MSSFQPLFSLSARMGIPFVCLTLKVRRLRRGSFGTDFQHFIDVEDDHELSVEPVDA
jgi:hypothetical protein